MGGKILALGVLVLAVSALFGLGVLTQVGWIIAAVGGVLVLVDR